jgi:hypothetical protein
MKRSDPKLSQASKPALSVITHLGQRRRSRGQVN